MVSREEFARHLRDAYEHLYDLVRLRTHPLTILLIVDAALTRKEKAWRLNQILQEAISEISPGPQAPVTSREWRRHRLMTLRYSDGLDAQSVAQELAISLRHYHREHKVAISAVANLLWERYVAQQPAPVEPDEGLRQQTLLSHQELLRLEAGRLAQGDRTADVNEVVCGVLSLLGQMQEQHATQVTKALPQSLPEAHVDPSLLRQILLEVLEAVIEASQGAAITLASRLEASQLCLETRVEPPLLADGTLLERMNERLALLKAMAIPSGISVSLTGSAGSVAGFEVTLPTVSQRTVLVVDDNEDLLELFRRYLSANGYRIVSATTAQDALALARQWHPYAITIDLMMPDQDGWQLLQTLRHHPETSDIPVIVCTVLRHQHLALSLGAVRFLEKPVTEKTLITALNTLSTDPKPAASV